MTAVPAAAPPTNPVPETTVAMSKLLLLQAPPNGVADKDVEDPTQTFVVPDMAEGNVLTDTIVVV